MTCPHTRMGRQGNERGRVRGVRADFTMGPRGLAPERQQTMKLNGTPPNVVVRVATSTSSGPYASTYRTAVAPQQRAHRPARKLLVGRAGVGALVGHSVTWSPPERSRTCGRSQAVRAEPRGPHPLSAPSNSDEWSHMGMMWAKRRKCAGSDSRSVTLIAMGDTGRERASGAQIGADNPVLFGPRLSRPDSPADPPHSR
jgi:hypothetical protein